MKLECNGCGKSFNKPNKDCHRYNREHKKGLCPKCKINSDRMTKEEISGLNRNFKW